MLYKKKTVTRAIKNPHFCGLFILKGSIVTICIRRT
nr:MAG TPA: Recombinase [Caudoviricetes sp.]